MPFARPPGLLNTLPLDAIIRGCGKCKIGELSVEQESQKIRVLIADDSQVVRNGLVSILRAHPDILVVGEAADGEEAARKVQDLRPDLVLMDVEMPGTSGLEATRRIKACCHETLVLFLAVHRSYMDEALKAGANGYLLKDSPRGELLAAIRRLRRQPGSGHQEAQA